MRLFTKIFLFGMLAFGGAFSVSGYFLLHYSMEGSMSRETDFALKQYQYDKFTVQSVALTYSDVSFVLNLENDILSSQEQTVSIWNASPYGIALPENGQVFIPYDQIPREELTEGLFRSLAEEISVPAAFFAEDGTLLYSEIENLELSFLDALSPDCHAYQFWNSPRGESILVGSMIPWDEWGNICFITQWDISKTIDQQNTLRQYFIRCYLIAITAGAALLGFLSALLTGPLKKMAKAAGRMAEGCYEERLNLKSSDEIGTLAESFNQMSAAVEEKIEELSRSAREKEDFVANFAHELKTPLTSIIGYADTIYQKELSREETRKASWHIWNEGMRLESLSLKLMELTILGSQNFTLQEMPAEELLADVAEGLSPILQNKQTALLLQTAPGYVMADYDLLKTLLINLVDNSIKAGGSRILLTGRQEGEKYLVCVEDNGCGMEQEELSRITEAFYMVDKARSRKQHGAGLGLALADRIARLHGGPLCFESAKGAGTRVSFYLNCPKTDYRKEESENA